VPRAREAARQAVRDADRAEAEAWSIQMEGYGGPAQPSLTIAMPQRGLTLAAGQMSSLRNRSQHTPRLRSPAARYADLETGVFAEMPLVPEGRYAPPVHLIRLTGVRQTVPYVWVHPDEDR
jgi:hypothetical protein